MRFVRPRKELGLLGLLSPLSKIHPRKGSDVEIERFYNFAGHVIPPWHPHGIPSLLEVNAPIIDPPTSLKTRLDWLFLGEMRWWAVQQAKWSAAIVTPLNTTIPSEVPRNKIHELPWGAKGRFGPRCELTGAQN